MVHAVCAVAWLCGGTGHKWVRAAGGILTADSPRLLFELVADLPRGRSRLPHRHHLGERPALSAKKCTLRRVDPNTVGDWHQDGAFLGNGIHTVNVWLSLSHCGRDAPGMDILPRHLDSVVGTGANGAISTGRCRQPT